MFRLPDQKFRLFDLVADPLEQTNLLEDGHEYNAAVAAELRERLVAWHDDAHPVDLEHLSVQDHLEALRSLGYVGDSPDDTKESDR